MPTEKEFEFLYYSAFFNDTAKIAEVTGLTREEVVVMRKKLMDGWQNFKFSIEIKI